MAPRGLGRALRCWSRLLRDERGNIAVLSALSMPVLLVLCAVAIDAVALFVERREAQSTTDLAAITAVNNFANATTLAQQVFEDNDVVADDYVWPGSLTPSIESLSVETGSYDANISIAAADRFVPGGAPSNAVRVHFNKPGRLYFAQMFAATPNIGTNAVAYSSGEATFMVGSRLASVSGGAANAVLSGLLGTSLSLTVADYNSLLGLDVNLFDFLDVLSTNLELEALTYSQILSTAVGLGDIITAMAEVAPEATTAHAALSTIDAAFTANPSLQLGELLGLGALANAEVNHPGDVAVSAMELLTASAVAANGTNQLATGIAVNAGGLATVTTSLTVGEPPQPGLLVATRADEIVRTAQARLTLTMTVGGSGLLTPATISLPLYLEVAYAEAQVSSVSCPAGGQTSATLAVKPGIARLWIGTPASGAMTTFASPASVSAATLVNVNILLAHIVASGSSFVDAGGGTQSVTFTEDEVAAGVIKTVSTGSPLSSISQSLINNLNVTVSLSGLGVPLPSVVTTALKTSLGLVAPTLDALINQLIGTLGVSVGEADVRVLNISCQRAVLVQ